MTKNNVIVTKAHPRNVKKREMTTKPNVVVELANFKAQKAKIATVRTTDKGFLVKHDEYVAAIKGATSSASSVYLNINPGNPTAFPWLSILAAGFEKFKIHKLSAKFQHTCAATLSGQYAMYFDYDARDPQVKDIDKVLQMMDVVNSPIYGDRKLPYKKSLESLKEYYIQRSNVPSVNWTVDETPAKLNVVVEGCAEPLINIGNLHLSYEIELIAPAIDVAPSTAILTNKATVPGQSMEQCVIVGLDGSQSPPKECQDYVGASIIANTPALSYDLSSSRMRFIPSESLSGLSTIFPKNVMALRDGTGFYGENDTSWLSNLTSIFSGQQEKVTASFTLPRGRQYVAMRWNFKVNSTLPGQDIKINSTALGVRNSSGVYDAEVESGESWSTVTNMGSGLFVVSVLALAVFRGRNNSVNKGDSFFFMSPLISYAVADIGMLIEDIVFSAVCEMLPTMDAITDSLTYGGTGMLSLAAQTLLRNREVYRSLALTGNSKNREYELFEEFLRSRKHGSDKRSMSLEPPSQGSPYPKQPVINRNTQHEYFQ